MIVYVAVLLNQVGSDTLFESNQARVATVDR